jgi:hypothetical protein
VIVNPTATPVPEQVALSDGDAPLVLAAVGLSLLVLVGVIVYGLLSRK